MKAIRKQTLNNSNYSDSFLLFSINTLHSSYLAENAGDSRAKNNLLPVNLVFRKNLTCVAFVAAHQKQRMLRSARRCEADRSVSESVQNRTYTLWHVFFLERSFFMRNKRQHFIAKPWSKNTSIFITAETHNSVFRVYAALKSRCVPGRGLGLSYDLLFFENLYFSQQAGKVFSFFEEKKSLACALEPLTLFEPILLGSEIKSIFFKYFGCRYPFTLLTSDSESGVGFKAGIIKIFFKLREFGNPFVRARSRFRTSFSEIENRFLRFEVGLVAGARAKILVLLLFLDKFCPLNWIKFVHLSTAPSKSSRGVRGANFVRFIEGRGRVGKRRVLDIKNCSPKKFDYRPQKKLELFSLFKTPLRFLYLHLLSARVIIAFKLIGLGLQDKPLLISRLVLLLKLEQAAVIADSFNQIKPFELRHSTLNLTHYNYNNFYRPYFLFILLLRFATQIGVTSVINEVLAFWVGRQIDYTKPTIFGFWCTFFTVKAQEFVVIRGLNLFNVQLILLFLRNLKFFTISVAFFFFEEFFLRFLGLRKFVVGFVLVFYTFLLLLLCCIFFYVFEITVTLVLGLVCFLGVCALVTLMGVGGVFNHLKFPSLLLHEMFLVGTWKHIFFLLFTWGLFWGSALGGALVSGIMLVLRTFAYFFGKLSRLFCTRRVNFFWAFMFNALLVPCRFVWSARSYWRCATLSWSSTLFLALPVVVKCSVFRFVKQILLLPNFYSTRNFLWVFVEFVYWCMGYPFWWTRDAGLFLPVMQFREIVSSGWNYFELRSVRSAGSRGILLHLLPHLSVLYGRNFFLPYEYFMLLGRAVSGSRKFSYLNKSYSDTLFSDYFVLKYLQKIFSTRAKFFGNTAKLLKDLKRSFFLFFVALVGALILLNMLAGLLISYICYLICMKQLLMYSQNFFFSSFNFVKRWVVYPAPLFFVCLVLIFVVDSFFLAYIVIKFFLIFFFISAALDSK